MSPLAVDYVTKLSFSDLLAACSIVYVRTPTVDQSLPYLVVRTSYVGLRETLIIISHLLQNWKTVENH